MEDDWKQYYPQHKKVLKIKGKLVLLSQDRRNDPPSKEGVEDGV